MKRSFLVFLMLVAMSGCSKKEESLSVAPDGASRGKTSQYLAYEHSISIETEENKVTAIFDASQAACRQASGDSCVVLESRINTGPAAYASLKIRATPAGIRKLIATLNKQGDVTDQSTTAEDLAVPIGDTAKKLAMLNDYRTKLEALRNRSNNDVDALIKLNKELAQVQSELEAATGTQAHLQERVNTEVLKIAISSASKQSFWRPIRSALSEFGRNLSEGISIAVTGIAFLIPWLFLLALFTWLGRKLWSRLRRSRTNTPRHD